MKKYYQKTHNDCVTATIATLLQVDPKTIPLFIENGKQWCKDYYDWLLKKHGLYAIRLSRDKYISDGRIDISKDIKCIGILHKKENKHTHAVIIDIVKTNEVLEYSIFHDPKKNSEYEIEDLSEIEFLCKLYHAK